MLFEFVMSSFHLSGIKTLYCLDDIEWSSQKLLLNLLNTCDGAHNLDIDVSTCARLIPPPGTGPGDHWPVCRCRWRGGAGSSEAGDNGMLNCYHCSIVIKMMLQSIQDYCTDIAAVISPVNINTIKTL